VPPSHPELRAWLHQARADESPGDGSACPDADTLGALADGSLADPIRASVLPHLASCSRCRATVASIARLLADPAVAREMGSRRTATPIRRWLPLAIPMAAAALLLVVLDPLGVSPPAPGDSHRASTIEHGAIPDAILPVGDVMSVRELRWGAVAGADRYRLTVFAPDGQVVYEVESNEAVASLPDSITLVPGRTYLWKVEARVGFDRWVSSPLVQFSLFPDPAR
jgi:anti-sigma factor RsiW